MTTGRDRYLADRIETASPEQLIKMLLDRAVAELEQARTELQASNRLGASPHLRRAQAIVGELRCCLDLSVGPIATNLDELYGFAFTELVDGNPDRVGDVVSVLEPVRDAWNQACCGLQPAG